MRYLFGTGTTDKEKFLEAQSKEFFKLLVNRNWLKAREFLENFAKQFPDLTTELLNTRCMEVSGSGDRHGFTPLLLCATLGNEDMVELLLNMGADPNLQGSTLNAEGPWSVTAIHDRLLHEFKYKHNSALHKACEEGNQKVVLRLLKEKNLDVNIKNIDGNTCLHVLLNSSKVKIQVKLFITSHLLQKAPNLIFIKNKKGLTILDLIDKNEPTISGISLSDSDKDLLQPLFDQFESKEQARLKAEVDGEGYELCLMSDESRIEENKLYVKKNNGSLSYAVIAPNGKTEKGEISRDEFKIYTKQGIPETLSIDALKPLLAEILEITAGRGHTYEGYTAIFDLLRQNKVDLLKKKIKMDPTLLSRYKNKKGDNLLFVAIYEIKDDKQCEDALKNLFELPEVKNLLLDRQANRLSSNNQQYTAMHVAAGRESPDILQYLTKELAKLSYPIKQLNNVKDEEGNTILHTAAMSKSDETLHYLIKNHKMYGLDLQAINDDDRNFLHIAVDRGITSDSFKKSIDVLRENGDEKRFTKILQERDIRGRRVLNIGAESAIVPVFRELCKLYKENPSLKDILFLPDEEKEPMKEPTIMHSAIYKNRRDIIDCFFQDYPEEFVKQISRKSVNYYDSQKGLSETPVALAARKGHDTLLIHLYLKANYISELDNPSKNLGSKILDVVSSEDTLCEAINNNNTYTIIQLAMTDSEIYKKIEKIASKEEKITSFNKKLFSYMKSIFVGVMEIMGPECLVFKGGGVKGLAYGGVLKGLEEISKTFRQAKPGNERVDILSNAKEVGGSSTGALISLAIGLDFSSDQVSDLIKEMSNISELLGGYDLCLIDEEKEEKIEKNKLYVKEHRGSIQYTVVAPNGKIERDEITGDEFRKYTGQEIPEPLSIDALKPWSSEILEITAERRHTRVGNEAEKFKKFLEKKNETEYTIDTILRRTAGYGEGSVILKAVSGLKKLYKVYKEFSKEFSEDQGIFRGERLLARIKELLTTCKLAEWVKEVNKEGLREIKLSPKDDKEVIHFFKKTTDTQINKYFENISFKQLERLKVIYSKYSKKEKHNMKDMHFVVTDLNRGIPVDFCLDKTPSISIVDAVRMSMSFPIFFKVHQPRYVEGNKTSPCYLHEIDDAPSDGATLLSGFHHYVDGGTIYNYPLKYLFGKKIEKSLGFFLTSPEELALIDRGKNPISDTQSSLITDDSGFFKKLAACVLNTEEREHFDSKTQMRQTVYISRADVDTLDFALTDDKRIRLEIEGRLSVINYFTHRLWAYFELRKRIRKTFSDNGLIDEKENKCQCIKPLSDFGVTIKFNRGFDGIDILTKFFNKEIDDAELGNLIKVKCKETEIQMTSSNEKIGNLMYVVCEAALAFESPTLSPASLFVKDDADMRAVADITPDLMGPATFPSITSTSSFLHGSRLPPPPPPSTTAIVSTLLTMTLPGSEPLSSLSSIAATTPFPQQDQEDSQLGSGQEVSEFTLSRVPKRKLEDDSKNNQPSKDIKLSPQTSLAATGQARMGGLGSTISTVSSGSSSSSSTNQPSIPSTSTETIILKPQ